jgi:hypothetical protein
VVRVVVRSEVIKTGHGEDDVKRLLAQLAKTAVLVGIPEDANMNGVEEGEISLAARAYINDRGDAAARIPQREFMNPGVRLKIKPIGAALAKAASILLTDGPHDPMFRAYLVQAGLHGQQGIQEKIRIGPFQVLSPFTLAMRRARGNEGIMPLLDTYKMYRNITYVVVAPKR